MHRQLSASMHVSRTVQQKHLWPPGWDDSEHRRRCWDIGRHQPLLPSCDISFRLLCRLVTQRWPSRFYPFECRPSTVQDGAGAASPAPATIKVCSRAAAAPAWIASTALHLPQAGSDHQPVLDLYGEV